VVFQDEGVGERECLRSVFSPQTRWQVLRRLTKQIQDARLARENEAIKRSLKDYDEALERSEPHIQPVNLTLVNQPD